MATNETNRMLAAAASACEDKKAEDIRILALDPAESGLTDYFLICNGTNDRQNLAIADEVELRLKRDFSTRPNSVEGRRQAGWILLDYVDFIVHVFSAEKRAFYGLERLRKSATTLSVDDLNAEIKAAIAAHRPKAKPVAPIKSKTPATKPGQKKSARTKTAAKKASGTSAARKAAQPSQTITAKHATSRPKTRKK
ncbi:MAG TPA: ribosome silencing factor [Acidobacteriaceae bacterium]|jgi:ribosome-associated protein|nr:ribosome silencing factor [Acidobacteriaceae bacterium]